MIQVGVAEVQTCTSHLFMDLNFLRKLLSYINEENGKADFAKLFISIIRCCYSLYLVSDLYKRILMTFQLVIHSRCPPKSSYRGFCWIMVNPFLTHVAVPSEVNLFGGHLMWLAGLVLWWLAGLALLVINWRLNLASRLCSSRLKSHFY